jgi:hypothetical protein
MQQGLKVESMKFVCGFLVEILLEQYILKQPNFAFSIISSKIDQQGFWCCAVCCRVGVQINLNRH